jgi:hypothetical protein
VRGEQQLPDIRGEAYADLTRFANRVMPELKAW